MAEANKIQIIGIGDNGFDGLAPAVRRMIEEADLLIGDERTLALVPPVKANRLPVGSSLDEAVAAISQSPQKKIAVLAGGDPLFYGLARFLFEKLGKERFHVEPHVSTMQLAFARVMESWEEAYLTNLANHSLENVVERIRTAETVGLFTTESCPPNAVARALLQRNIDYFLAYVCENLGSPDERVTQGTLPEIASQEFAPLNVMILIRQHDAPDRPADPTRLRLFGNPDDAFVQSTPKHGLMTPAEVRSMALAEMNLHADSTVWDVGAGSGSVSIEAARLAHGGTTYAIEMDADQYHLIQENAKRFGVSNVVAVLGKAPEAWGDLPDPDSVFMEGSGRQISRLVDLAFQRLKTGGCLVANVGSIENISDVHQNLSRSADRVQVWMINVARGTYQLERVRFDALNPTFLLAASK